MKVTTRRSYGKRGTTWLKVKKGLFLHRVNGVGDTLAISLCIEGAVAVFANQANTSLTIIYSAVVGTESAPDLFVLQVLV